MSSFLIRTHLNQLFPVFLLFFSVVLYFSRLLFLFIYGPLFLSRAPCFVFPQTVFFSFR